MKYGTDNTKAGRKERQRVERLIDEHRVRYGRPFPASHGETGVDGELPHHPDCNAGGCVLVVPA